MDNYEMLTKSIDSRKRQKNNAFLVEKVVAICFKSAVSTF